MSVYDCFQYYNEDHIVDLRLNILNDYVDYFVISESTKTHQGIRKKLNFNIKNFKKFEKKIIYTVADYDLNENILNHKGGESKIEIHQRNNLANGLNKASGNDLIILSDSDEIPDMEKLLKKKNLKKFTAFSQSMFMYKLNLKNLDESGWIGSKVVLKKNLTTMQDLRDKKFKNFPKWRIDKWNQEIINGGWHFSFLQNVDDINNKIKSYSHGEFNKKDFFDKENITKRILNKEDIFDRNFKLIKVDLDNNFPEYILKNKKKLNEWIL